MGSSAALKQWLSLEVVYLQVMRSYISQHIFNGSNYIMQRGMHMEVPEP